MVDVYKRQDKARPQQILQKNTLALGYSFFLAIYQVYLKYPLNQAALNKMCIRDRLKAKEQMKGQEEKKESVLGAIKKYQAEDRCV